MIREYIFAINKLIPLNDDLQKAADLCCESIFKDNKIMLFGNGGSAAECQHFAAEMMMRIHTPRMPFPAISLASDASVITAIANDSGADQIFARQVDGIAMPGDTVICFSARGHSPAVIEGVKAAKNAGCNVVGLLGRNGGKLFDMVDVPILIQSDCISHVHAAHSVAMHVIADLIEQGFDRMVNEIGESS